MSVRNPKRILTGMPVIVFLVMALSVMMPTKVFAGNCPHCQTLAAQAPDCCLGDMVHDQGRNESSNLLFCQKGSMCYYRGGHEHQARCHSAHSIDVLTAGSTLSSPIEAVTEERRQVKRRPPLLQSFPRHILYCSFLI